MQDDGHFGADVAARYDADPEANDPALVAATVDCLRRLAAGGRALEFAVGTGRIALPLAAAGVPVSGIDLSAAMVAQLRAKPGGSDIPVILGDMTEARAGDGFALVYLVFNTINNLTTQAAQVACFENAAVHLAPGGAFVVEVGVPQLQRLPRGERLVPVRVGPERWTVDEYDVVSQEFWSHHAQFDGAHVRRETVPFRYVWPAELDLMARLAGLRLSHRWEDWAGNAFGPLSERHVSVWRLPA